MYKNIVLRRRCKDAGYWYVGENGRIVFAYRITTAVKRFTTVKEAIDYRCDNRLPDMENSTHVWEIYVARKRKLAPATKLKEAHNRLVSKLNNRFAALINMPEMAQLKATKRELKRIQDEALSYLISAHKAELQRLSNDKSGC